MYKLEGKYGSSRAVSIRLNTLTISPTWDLGLVLLQVYCVAKGDIRVAYTRAKPATIFRRTLYYHVNKRSRESGCNSNSSKNHDLDTYPGFAGAVTETSDEGHQTSNICKWWDKGIILLHLTKQIEQIMFGVVGQSSDAHLVNPHQSGTTLQKDRYCWFTCVTSRQSLSKRNEGPILLRCESLLVFVENFIVLPGRIGFDQQAAISRPRNPMHCFFDTQDSSQYRRLDVF